MNCFDQNMNRAIWYNDERVGFTNVQEFVWNQIEQGKHDQTQVREPYHWLGDE